VSDLEPQPVDWLWPGRLALGKLAILDGDPGLGKSLVTLDLCARLSTGRPFPDGSAGPGAGTAIVVNGEDNDRDTTRPRLQALGADLERVFVFRRANTAVPLCLPEHTALLDEALARTGARLLVIDPIMAFLGPGVLAGNDPSVRRALLPLAQLAERYGCVILLVRHLNKAFGGRALYRGAGSLAFLSACRSGWLIAPDPQQPERRVLAQVKNNLAPPQPSLAFTVLTPADTPPVLSWLGPTALTADAVLAGPAAGPAPGPRQRAREFLAHVLAEGPRTPREIWGEARAAGLAERTLHRARKDLDIRSVRVEAEGRPVCYWLLPGQQLPAAVRGHDEAADLDALLAALRERFPPSTPLDER
jgi:hypothetical protein